MMRAPRDQRVPVALTREEVHAIARAAAKVDMTSGEYIRACTLTTMALQADPLALKALLHAATAAARDFVQATARRTAET